jgi:hypothetical protein
MLAFRSASKATIAFGEELLYELHGELGGTVVTCAS